MSKTAQKTAQNWFDKKYLKDRKAAKKININSNSLNNLFTSIEGPLRIVDFEKIKSVNLKNLKLTSLEISNCPGLTKLDLSELSRLASLSVSDCPGPTVLDFSQYKLTQLTSLEISNCTQLTELGLSELSKLKNLSVNDCLKLTELDLSKYKLTQLTELEVNNLNKLDCSNTSIKKLSLNLCPNITKLNCSNNNKLIYLDISNCSKLEFINCTNSGLTSLDLSNCPKIKDEDLPSNLKIIREKEVRNILIVGRTGGGKSTLSNVLSGTNEFEESASSVSVTKNFQKKGFAHEGIKYRVVDTIGVGDTKLTKKQVLYKIAEGIYSMPEGISQVLFVIDGRFTEVEIDALKLFEESIFSNDKNDNNENNILNYCTIVRTKFSNFKNENACETDRKQLLEETTKISKLIESCNDIVYVDNPPTNIIENDEEDKATNLNNQRTRKKSREILLKHLEKLSEEKFKLKTWDVINDKIIDYINKNPDKKLTEEAAGLIDEENPEIKPLLHMCTFI